MPEEIGISRREFLKATTKTGASLAALGGMGLTSRPEGAEASPAPSESQVGSPTEAKGNWPQKYSVHRDEASGHLALSTPYYSVVHDLKRGGAITHISYTHGAVSNLLIEPMEASIELAAKKLLHHVTKQEHGPAPEGLSDLHDSSPSVTVTNADKGPFVTIGATLRTPEGRDIGVRTKTIYKYRWGFIKIRKEFVFPAGAVHTSRLTVLSTMLHPSLTHYGCRPNVFENSDVNPFGIEKIRWGKIRPGTTFDVAFATRYVPRYIVLGNPGIEGIEWFVSDDLSQWDYQITGQPGTNYATISPNTEPLGITVSINPLSLPTNSDLARGGFISLKGSYSFDYYLGIPILEGHAHTRWLERSFYANSGRWVSDDEIRRNAEYGIVTMTLHDDGDSNGDGLFWRDGSYPPYPPDQMKKMEHVLDTCHKCGIKTLPYFSNHELHESTEAFRLHGEEWARKPDDQGNLRPNYFYGAHMCLKSGWFDFFKSYVDAVLKHHPFDGVYYDWNGALYCNNPLHVGETSNGVTDATGLATYAYSRTGHWDIDELLDLMEWTRKRVGPSGLVAIHNTMIPMFATENFADYVVGMEWGYGSLSDGMPEPGELPLEWNFVGARSRADIEYGTIAAKAAPRIHRLFHLTTLITGTAPWPANYESADLFKILKPLGNLQQYQFEDWRNRAVRLGSHDVFSAIYSRPGEAYILLANLLPKACEVTCRIDPQVIKNPQSSVSSAVLIDKVKTVAVNVQRLTGSGEKLLLPADGVRLLQLRD